MYPMINQYIPASSMKHSLNSHQRRNHILWHLDLAALDNRDLEAVSNGRPLGRRWRSHLLPERKGSGRGFYFLFFARTGCVGITFAAASCRSINKASILQAFRSMVQQVMHMILAQVVCINGRKKNSAMLVILFTPLRHQYSSPFSSCMRDLIPPVEQSCRSLAGAHFAKKKPLLYWWFPAPPQVPSCLCNSLHYQCDLLSCICTHVRSLIMVAQSG